MKRARYSTVGRVCMGVYVLAATLLNIALVASVTSRLNAIEPSFPIADALQILGVFAVFSF